MNTTLRPLALAMCAVLATAVVVPAFAQDTGTSSMRDQRAKRM